MKATWIKVLWVLAAGLFALAAPASAQVSTTATGPYYATPSWDQKLTTNRFVVLSNWNNEAVLDRETGLVWERAPATQTYTWTQPLACLDRATGGRKGWRVPGIQELASLVDTGAANPALPAGHPFLNVAPSVYWSSTTSYNTESAAWVVNFSGGNVTASDKSDGHTFWCVRDGQGPDHQ